MPQTSESFYKPFFLIEWRQPHAGEQSQGMLNIVQFLQNFKWWMWKPYFQKKHTHTHTRHVDCSFSQHHGFSPGFSMVFPSVLFYSRCGRVRHVRHVGHVGHLAPRSAAALRGGRPTLLMNGFPSMVVPKIFVVHKVKYPINIWMKNGVPPFMETPIFGMCE